MLRSDYWLDPPLPVFQSENTTYCWQERNACFRFSIVRQDEIHVNTPNAAKVRYLEAIWAKPRHSLA